MGYGAPGEREPPSRRLEKVLIGFELNPPAFKVWLEFHLG